MWLRGVLLLSHAICSLKTIGATLTLPKLLTFRHSNLHVIIYTFPTVSPRVGKIVLSSNNGKYINYKCVCVFINVSFVKSKHLIKHMFPCNANETIRIHMYVYERTVISNKPAAKQGWYKAPSCLFH